jgi:hypothetical protein
LTITGLEESGGFLIESRQSPLHGVNDALGNTGASRGRGDAANYRDLLHGLARSRRRANSGRFGGNQFGGADGLNGHGTRLGVPIKDELNLCPLQDSVHDILGPFGAEDDGSATSEPDSMSSGDIINLEAMT